MGKKPGRHFTLEQKEQAVQIEVKSRVIVGTRLYKGG